MTFPVPLSDMAHKVARCRWCGEAFRQVYGYQWICPTLACAEKCLEWSVKRREAELVDGDSPFLFLALPLQVDVELSPVRRLLVHGQAGVSKSYGGRWLAYKWAMRYEGQMILLLRVTIEQLRKNHLAYAEDEVELLGEARGNVKYTKTPDHLIRFKETGSKIYLGYCDSENDIGQHKGPEWDLIIFEQGEEFLPRAINTITSRDRGSPTGRPHLIKQARRTSGRSVLLCNAGGRAASFLDDHYINRDPDRRVYPEYTPDYYGQIEGFIEDNPYLPEDYLKATLGGLDATTYAQLAQNRRDVFEGQFFPEFDRRIHVTDMEV